MDKYARKAFLKGYNVGDTVQYMTEKKLEIRVIVSDKDFESKKEFDFPWCTLGAVGQYSDRYTLLKKGNGYGYDPFEFSNRFVASIDPTMPYSSLNIWEKKKKVYEREMREFETTKLLGNMKTDYSDLSHEDLQHRVDNLTVEALDRGFVKGALVCHMTDNTRKEIISDRFTYYEKQDSFYVMGTGGSCRIYHQGQWTEIIRKASINAIPAEKKQKAYLDISDLEENSVYVIENPDDKIYAILITDYDDDFWDGIDCNDVVYNIMAYKNGMPNSIQETSILRKNYFDAQHYVNYIREANPDEITAIQMDDDALIEFVERRWNDLYAKINTGCATGSRPMAEKSEYSHLILDSGTVEQPNLVASKKVNKIILKTKADDRKIITSRIYDKFFDELDEVFTVEREKPLKK